jgi:hypothetical protein
VILSLDLKISQASAISTPLLTSCGSLRDVPEAEVILLATELVEHLLD